MKNILTEDLKNIKEIKNVQLIIKDDNQKTVYQHTLKLKQVEKLSCSSKTFKVEFFLFIAVSVDSEK